MEKSILDISPSFEALIDQKLSFSLILPKRKCKNNICIAQDKGFGSKNKFLCFINFFTSGFIQIAFNMFLQYTDFNLQINQTYAKSIYGVIISDSSSFWVKSSDAFEQVDLNLLVSACPPAFLRLDCRFSIGLRSGNIPGHGSKVLNLVNSKPFSYHFCHLTSLQEKMHSWHKIAPGSLEEVATDIFTVGGFLYQKFETISLKCAERSLREFRRPNRFCTPEQSSNNKSDLHVHMCCICN